MIAGVPGALATLTIVGSVYLLWLGVTTLFNPPTLHGVVPDQAVDAASGEPIASGASVRATTPARQFWTGAGISGLNPKALLTYVVLLPQFTSVDNTWPMMIQLGVLGHIHTFNCVLVYLIVGFSVRKVLSKRPAAAQWVSRASGVVMIIIALTLVGEQIAHWL
ncbi:LysE family translocator [Rothia terrae]|uniref:LysE family translocator n=2 Tax=Rothia terrae TaxID=396015 RepID=UPI002880E882|nr:LysE family transporter [Rothia terrae]MDT0189599.1 LysE family transporter [Rothia terrae]